MNIFSFQEHARAQQAQLLIEQAEKERMRKGLITFL